MSAIILYFSCVICGIAIIADLGSIYFINHIWCYRKHKFIQSRSPTLTYSVLWTFFSLLLLAIINTVIHNFADFYDATYFFIVNDFIQYGCTFAYATRAWILFYHVEWSYESVNHVWRTQLRDVKQTVSQEALQSGSFDMAIQSPENDEFEDKSLFWMKYRDSLGNWKKVFPMTMGVLFPLFIISLDILPFIVFNIKQNEANNRDILILRGVNILCYLVIFILIKLLIRRIHTISDRYGIGHELEQIDICFAMFILIGRILNGILIIALETNDKLIQINTFIAGLCTIFSILCSLYIGSFFVLRRLFAVYAGNETMKDFNHRETLKNVVTFCQSTALDANDANNLDMDGQNLTLNRVLASQYGFETFTQFLISELSVENILFLVEVKQYKACCRKYHKAEKSPMPVNGQTNTHIIALGSNSDKSPSFDPSTVKSLRPTTTTRSKPNVFKSKSIMNVDYVPSNSMLQTLDPYDYAVYLYGKYVIDGSDLQINIPSKTKKMLTKFLIKTDKMDVIILDDYTDKMFQLYDKAWEQIHKLMKSDSYSRFRYTADFSEICMRAKEEDDKKHKEILQHNKNGNGYDEFLSQPKPSLLDWEYNEMVMVDMVALNHNSIPEDAEVDLDENEMNNTELICNNSMDMSDDDLEAELKKLNSINDYDGTKKKEAENVGISEQEVLDAMNVLNDIASFPDSDEN